jgi:FixJ family two-component response regulator
MRDARPIVAVVDDDPRLLDSLGDLLESAGYAARGYPSADALLHGGLGELDLLITDIGMPGMDGLELRELVRAARPELPVFLITGRQEIADRERARGGGVLFAKPFDAGALLATVGEALGSSRREDEHES